MFVGCSLTIPAFTLAAPGTKGATRAKLFLVQFGP